MPISFNNRRCSDPNLYSLKNNLCHHDDNTKTPINMIYLPPLMASINKNAFEKQHQFSDTSCQERSIMIDKLIDCSADIIDSIWFNKNRSTKIMSTSHFIREILKRSRATYSMLQLALFYIFRIKKLIFERMQQPSLPQNELICCGRRMFLAALMVSSKYLNDKNYRNKTWAKIASLHVAEINATELVFLRLIDYQLYVSKPLYDKWVSLLHDHIQKKSFITIARQQHYGYYHHHTIPSIATTLPPPPHYTSSNSNSNSNSSNSSVSSSCNSSPNTSVTFTPPDDMQQTPPLVYGRKRSCSSVSLNAANKHARHV